MKNSSPNYNHALATLRLSEKKLTAKYGRHLRQIGCNPSLCRCATPLVRSTMCGDDLAVSRQELDLATVDVVSSMPPKTIDAKVMALEDIKQNIDRDIREPLLPVCRALVDRLATMKPNQLQRLTYMLLAGFVHRSPDDDVFQSALTALTTIKHNPLTMYFVFYDAGDDREIAISGKEAMQSVDDACFIHPRTGEEVSDFERQLKPVFKASNEFMAALTGGHDG